LNGISISRQLDVLGHPSRRLLSQRLDFILEIVEALVMRVEA
jgi:hypothetical protein